MLKIYVARHGQNEDNAKGILNGRRDWPLTELGRRQGGELADGIRRAGLVFDAVYTSPLRRAGDTAKVICFMNGWRAPIMMPSLVERDFGSMTGKTIADIETLCAPDIVKTDTITYFLSPPGAETFPALLSRAERVIKDVQARHPAGAVLLVTHGDFGKMLYAAYYRLPWLDMLTKFHFGNAELLELSSDSPADLSHVIRIDQHNH